MEKPNRHETHPAIVNRLRRARGHLDKVIAMMQAGEPCMTLAQQLQAVESAVARAKAILIEDHLDHCLDHVAGPLDAGKRRQIEEFKKMARYL